MGVSLEAGPAAVPTAQPGGITCHQMGGRSVCWWRCGGYRR